MSLRLIACLLLTVSVSACSHTPDRYAFWRDDQPASNNMTTPPNLGDVPASPNVAQAKSEMATIRDRLEIERQNAFRSADGLDPLPLPVDATDYQLMPAPAQEQAYIYGDTPLQQKAYQEKMAVASPTTTVIDPSISIDMSVLNQAVYGGSVVNSVPSPVITNGSPVAFFAHGSAQPKKDDLASLATQVQQHPGRVVLVGHASQRTNVTNPAIAQRINLNMSVKRAETVMQALTRQGVPADKVKIAAMGDSQPNINPQGQSQEDADRRVEVLFDR
jgi:outer membrane protein OmpA-like peptidoglycan-associated protein